MPVPTLPFSWSSSDNEPDTRPQFEVPSLPLPSLFRPNSDPFLVSLSQKVECPSPLLSLPLFPKCVPIIWQYITMPPFALSARVTTALQSSARTQSEDTRRRPSGLFRPSVPLSLETAIHPLR